MKKQDYERFINPEEFASLYNEWSAAGKPTGNNQLYVKIWDGVTNSVKACIGALQSKYHCKYADYNDKIIDGTIVMVKKLLRMNETPKNIVSLCYLPCLGVCCGPQTKKAEIENNMLSTDEETSSGDTFTDLVYVDEYGDITYCNY